MTKIKSEDAPDYFGSSTKQFHDEVEKHCDDEAIKLALKILGNRLKRSENFKVTCPNDTKTFLVLKLAELEHEVFAIMFLDNHHQLIKYEEMFRGTIDGANVYPREILKQALKLNAAACIVAHNHPSGVPEPSMSDKNITHKLENALKLVDIRLLDHIIVGGTSTVSLAERGIL